MDQMGLVLRSTLHRSRSTAYCTHKYISLKIQLARQRLFTLFIALGIQTACPSLT